MILAIIAIRTDGQAQVVIAIACGACGLADCCAVVSIGGVGARSDADSRRIRVIS